MSRFSDYTVYVDDSGTHNEARVVSGGCCVSSVPRWKYFEQRWKKIEQQEGFRNFHMTEFAGCRPDQWCRDCRNNETSEKEHPWRDWSIGKRKRVITALAETVNHCSDYGLGMAFIKKDYDDYVLTSPLKALGALLVSDEYYTFAVQCLGGGIGAWRTRINLKRPLKYVFDTTDNIKQKDELAQLFIQSATASVKDINDGIRPSGYSFENRRDLVQLLSADMLAWISAKNMAADIFGASLSKEANIVRRTFIRGKKLGIGKLETMHIKEWAEKEISMRQQKAAAANAKE